MSLFVSIEGFDGVGKTTQANLLHEHLSKEGVSSFLVREPGGTIVSEKIRKIILDNKNDISNNEELLLLMSSRLNHINNVIKPAMNKGKLVISDRFCDSTFVYQCYVNGYGISKGLKLHKDLLDNFLPNKTFLFLISPEEIIKRLKKRKKNNKYDKINLSFHKKIILGYKKISKSDNRFILINANKNFNYIQKILRSEIYKIIN